ncbi:AP2-like ethylene-responsive transcription factor PLT2 [Rosa sericea]
MSMNSNNFRFHSSESMDSNLNLQPDNPFQLPSSIRDAPNDCNFTVANYPVPPPLPLGAYEGFITGANNSTSGGNQTRYENGRCEAFVWDNTDPEEKSKTSGFEVEEDAARAHDLAALKLWGESASLNFPLSNYVNDLEEMKSFTKKEYFLHIRRSKTGLAKTVSNYRGVSRNAHNKKWQVRLGKGKDIDSIYVGTFDTEEQAAEAYDVAAIRVKGPKAITNFDKSNYDVKQILESPKFLIDKGASKTLKRSSVDEVLQKRRKTRNDSSSTSSAPPSLHPIHQTQPTAIDSSLQYQFPIPYLQVPVPHGYQNPTFEANRSFSPQYDYGGSEQTAQFQPIIPLLNQEFPSHQYYNSNSQHHLDQTPSSQFLQDTQNPNLVAGLNNLASDRCMEEFSSSQVHEASFEMMGTNEGGAHGDSSQVVGNLGDSVFGPGNSDLDPASWLETFLRMSPQRPDSKV